MKTAEIKNLFIIDGKELQNKIDELQIVYNEGTADVFDITKLALYKELQQSLSPLEPIVEKAFDAGRTLSKRSQLYAPDFEYEKQDFLNKPIEL